jgi:hypothetical protein
VKAKVGSLPTSYSTVNSAKHLHGSNTSTNYPQHHHTTCSKYVSSNLPASTSSAQQPYRSVLIEKHTPSGSGSAGSNSAAEKTTTTQVKFAMPMQSTKVLNKVITTPIHY